MKQPFILAFFFTALLFVGACSGLPIEKIPLKQPLETPDDAQPSPIGFNKIAFAIPTGESIQSSSARGPLGFFYCDLPYGLIPTRVSGKGFPKDEWRGIFFQTLEGLGYDVTGNPGRLFDEGADLQRTIYSVGGRITDIKIDRCQRSNIWGVDKGIAAEANVTVEWTVYDLLERRNVYKLTTRGYGKTAHAMMDGNILAFEEALAGAIHNLGADEVFQRLAFYGDEPESIPDTIADPYEEPITLFNPNEKLTLDNSEGLSTVPAQDRFDDLLDNVVMIQAGHSHGSGFFVSKQGHILTNAHVVGLAKRVRVVSSGKKKKMVAEVLRLNRKRDVALLRLEYMPEALQKKINPFPVRVDKVRVGEELYAIGSPSYERLQDTVTRGILSAHRYDRKKGQPLLQADVTIHGGNSGGPLIDAHGNLIGMAVAGYVDGAKDLSGLNLFIPIDDALKKLDITVQK